MKKIINIRTQKLFCLIRDNFEEIIACARDGLTLPPARYESSAAIHMLSTPGMCEIWVHISQEIHRKINLLIFQVWQFFAARL